jgi:HAD superfamily hydrolase (TIGR01509 family)
MEYHIKNIIFDLDGVLVDSREIHYNSLNNSLKEINEKFVIELSEHLSTYDGLSTTKKLELLTLKKGLPRDLHSKVWYRKQFFSSTLIKELIKPNQSLRSLLLELKKDYQLFCCSNSIKQTLVDTLECLGILDLFTNVYSNEDILLPKPHPNIYLKCFVENKLIPRECLIIEDSPIGKTAAYLSEAHILPVANENEVKYTSIIKSIENANAKNMNNKIDIRWISHTQVVIPMAGEGSRFRVEGYSDPKPLIKIGNKYMIELVIENLNLYGAKYIFIVQKKHNIGDLLKSIIPDCVIVTTETLTQGPADSVLLAKNVIDPGKDLLIANCDQFLEWDINSFMYSSKNVDGCISVFEQNDPLDKKWSYVKLNSEGFVSEVKEKECISNIASTGIYYFKKAGDFLKYTQQMMSKNIRTNNEFYIAPVYNEAIADSKKIKVSYCKKMWGLGVPSDLKEFISKN